MNTSLTWQSAMLLTLFSAGCYAWAAPAVSPNAVSPGDANIVFPDGSGVLNVKDVRFGAKGDGITDDTTAIQKAITAGLNAHRVVYLPDGIYLVSDTLRWQNIADVNNSVQGWGPFLQLQGQSRAKTIIRLKPGSVGFDNAEAPKAVIATGSSGAHGGKTYKGGEGNEAFENHLRNFSVDAGKGNAGAVGIDFQASNVGAMRHVSIKGEGFCGIALTRRDNGPALIKDVSVEGFNFGVRIYQEIAHFTLEDVDLKGQSEAGIWMRDAIIGARKIRSQNSVPAIQIAGTALLALFDSEFSGGAGAAAITTQGTEPRLYIRNLKTEGYAASVRLRGQTQKTVLAEWSSDAPLGNTAGKLSLNLPIRDTPEWYDADPKNWAVLPPPSGGDDTKAVQAALDSGKATVFFCYGRYAINAALRVPPSVKRLQGAGSSLELRSPLPEGAATLMFEGGKAGDLTIIDRFECKSEGAPLVGHRDARTIVLRDLLPWTAPIYRNEKGSGPLFIEDISSAGFYFAPGTQVWARQWNLEGRGNPKMVNDGGTIWALGNKHEGADTIWVNQNGGRLEAWAGFAYTFGASPRTPAAINTDASLALQMTGMTFVPNGYYDLLVKDTQNGTTVETRRAQVIARGAGATLPLYVSISTQAPALAANTQNTTIPKNTTLPKEDMKLKTLAAVAALATAPAIVTPQIVTRAQAQTAPKTFNAPQFFDGEEKGKPTGNPVEVGGKPMWTAVQIWPDDIFKRENYKPMNWAGDKWRGAYEFGGQPEVSVAAGKIGLGSRGGRDGDGTNPGAKRAAMLFTAPATGTYKVMGTIRSFVWEGDKASGSNLSVLKHDKATGKITRVTQTTAPNETVVPIEDTQTQLNAGDELILLNAVNSNWTAAALDVRDLKIEFTPGGAGDAAGAAGAAAPTDTPKVGAIVEIGGKSYKVVKVDGKQITLEVQ